MGKRKRESAKRKAREARAAAAGHAEEDEAEAAEEVDAEQQAAGPAADIEQEPSGDEEQEDDEENDEEEADDDDTGSLPSAGEINVDFEFFDPKPGDYHGIKALLRRYLGDIEWDIGGMADLIEGQSTVGTIIKTADNDDEDDGPLGFITALNLCKHKEQACIKDVRKYMLKACKEEDVRKQLQAALAAPKTGLIVSERVVNCPPELVSPLHDALFDEICWATEDEPTPEARAAFKFDQYIIMTRVLRDNAPKADQAKKLKKSKKTKQATEEVIYIKPEDQVFQELATWSFTFPLPSVTAPDKSLQSVGLVLCLQASKVQLFRSKLAQLLSALE
eukprot:jgi/Chlat1/121/Chrsp1S03092